jgi:hypothetical protein
MVAKNRFTQFWRVPSDLRAVLLIYGWLSAGIAIGGLFGRMILGFLIALGLILVIGLLVLVAALFQIG